MKKDLFAVNSKININDYSLIEIANYFRKYDNCTFLISTSNQLIKFRISISILPHLIGLQYAYNGTEYRGEKGFYKLLCGEITYSDVRMRINHNGSNISIKNIRDRIEYLPMFLNLLGKNNIIKFIDNDKKNIRTKIKGNILLYRYVKILSIKQAVENTNMCLNK